MTESYFYIRDRELGRRPAIGSRDTFYKSLYSSMGILGAWDERSRDRVYGGVFNLEFSPDGSLLVAACEKKSIVLFDPLSQTEITVVDNAHRDCVNCVKFLDNRMFATCSDDTTIALWDARNLKGRIRTLQGHSNWVKNIEYTTNQGLLVTSGFDGSIYTWDINSYADHGNHYQRVFHTAGLMRCRISPDEQKLVICTTGGYLILVHNLDLKTLGRDLEGFKPNIYRLMQVGHEYLPVAANYSHLFSKSRTRNRVELVTDFPHGNDAEVISSLQIHPLGWCALSRNINNDESSEWTCIHDIQELGSENEDEDIINQEDEFRLDVNIDEDDDDDDDDEDDEVESNAGWTSTTLRPSTSNDSNQVQPPVDLNRTENNGANNEENNTGSLSRTGHQDLWEAMLTLREHQLHRMQFTRGRVTTPNSLIQRLSGINSGLMNNIISLAQNRRALNVPSTSGSTISNFEIIQFPPQIPSRNNPLATGKKDLTKPINYMYKNEPRLIYYKEEANLGKGFIKELCFSSDGRIVCSPFGQGVRLLAFSEKCSELSYLNPINGQPKELLEISTKVCHNDIVVSTKFSPRHSVLVTGCLSGRIVWHQPVL